MRSGMNTRFNGLTKQRGQHEHRGNDSEGGMNKDQKSKMQKRAKRIRGELLYLHGVAQRCLGPGWSYDKKTESFVRAA